MGLACHCSPVTTTSRNCEIKSDRKMVIRKEPVFIIKRCYTFDEWLQMLPSDDRSKRMKESY